MRTKRTDVSVFFCAKKKKEGKKERKTLHREERHMHTRRSEDVCLHPHLTASYTGKGSRNSLTLCQGKLEVVEVL